MDARKILRGTTHSRSTTTVPSSLLGKLSHTLLVLQMLNKYAFKTEFLAVFHIWSLSVVPSLRSDVLKILAVLLPRCPRCNVTLAQIRVSGAVRCSSLCRRAYHTSCVTLDDVFKSKHYVAI
nr:uncharacterized protein LOC118878066 isoform X3 [Drosophila suzukii]